MDKGYVCFCFEIWEAIIIQVNDIKTHGVLAPACKTFHQIIESFRRKYLKIALLYRLNDQIALAQKCLLMCANAGGDSMAMVHLGFAYAYSGWNIIQDPKLALEWFKRASDMKNELGYALFLRVERTTITCKTILEEEEQGDEMFLSNMRGLMRKINAMDDDIGKFTNSCAIAICLMYACLVGRALPYLREAAIEDNCEFAQFIMGEIHRQGLAGLPNNPNTALVWYEMAAKQGLAAAQHAAGSIYYHKAKYERSHMTEEQYKFVKSRYQLWFGKAIAQGCTIIKKFFIF